MARHIEIDKGFRNRKCATMCSDGSLVIRVRFWGLDRKNTHVESFVFSPKGVKELKALLDRAAELQDEAVRELADIAPKELRTEDL